MNKMAIRSAVGGPLTKSQVEMTQAFAALYEQHTLIVDSAAPALWTCCVHSDDCWRDAADLRPDPDHGGDGGLSLPWVGPDYRPGGVAVLGINHNDASGLAVGFELARMDKLALAEGWKRINYNQVGYRGTDYPYRTTRSAASVLDLLDRAPVEDHDDPIELVPTLDRLVRLQSIKCSPWNGSRGEPTDPMWSNCPPLLLLDEIAIAAPTYVLAFGRKARWALERLPGVTGSENRSGTLWSGSLDHAQGTCRLVALGHPSGSRWPASHEALVRRLRRESRTA